jgi:Zn-dependent M28 family amino/carboxypeptidase
MKRILFISFVILIALFNVMVHSEESKPAPADKSTRQFSDDPALDSLIVDYIAEIDSASIGDFMQGLVSFDTRFMLADNNRDIAIWIRDKFKSFGFADVRIDSFQNTIEFPLKSGTNQTSWQYNVMATLKGIEDSNRVCVLGAHYDSFIMGIDPYKFCPGANNNASGVAACLEIARIMQKKGFQPKYTIEFVAFGSEEFMTLFVDGKSGSEHYVSRIPESGKKIELMIDNNQISYAPHEGTWMVDFQNCPGSEWLTDLGHHICQKYTRIVPVDTSDHINYTDAYYFWKAGHPSIFFEEFYFNPYTFTDKDIPENCNMAYCAEVTKISCGILVYCNYKE